MKSYSWMKLLLDPALATKYDDPSLAESEGQGVLQLPPGVTAVDLCADYLCEVIDYVFTTLKKRLSPEVMFITPIEFWLTVPAVWSDKARNNTLQAARQAAELADVPISDGTQLFLISEPEAAAAATLYGQTKGGSQRQIKVGQVSKHNILMLTC